MSLLSIITLVLIQVLFTLLLVSLFIRSISRRVGVEAEAAFKRDKDISERIDRFEEDLNRSLEMLEERLVFRIRLTQKDLEERTSKLMEIISLIKETFKLTGQQIDAYKDSVEAYKARVDTLSGQVIQLEEAIINAVNSIKQQISTRSIPKGPLH